jgi:hypothetical protein
MSRLSRIALMPLVATAVVAFPLAAPPATEAAHPCFAAEAPQITLLGVARAGRPAEFKVTGTLLPWVDWGDGTRPRQRELSDDGTLRHRFARPGRYVVTVVGRNGECCNIEHTSCSTTPSTPDRLAVRVHRR